MMDLGSPSGHGNLDGDAEVSGPGNEAGERTQLSQRRWSDEERARIVSEMVAQRYNLNANQVFRWRRRFQEPERDAGSVGFAPVVVRAATGHEASAATVHPPSESVAAEDTPATGRMEIVLPGERRVIVDRSVDRSALARVVAVLERRRSLFRVAFEYGSRRV